MGDRPPASARHVVLVGLMGVGKSTVGRRLAKELARPFADLDEQVELREGMTIPTIFTTAGEERFRHLETEVLADLLGRSAPLVVAAGGGAVTGATNRSHLAGAYVVWLRASAEFLAGRTDPTHRPLLADDPQTTMARLLAERTPLYEQVADVAVDVEPFHAGDDKPKRALARHIAALVADSAGSPSPAGAPSGPGAAGGSTAPGATSGPTDAPDAAAATDPSAAHR